MPLIADQSEHSGVTGTLRVVLGSVTKRIFCSRMLGIVLKRHMKNKSNICSHFVNL